MKLEIDGDQFEVPANKIIRVTADIDLPGLLEPITPGSEEKTRRVTLTAGETVVLGPFKSAMRLSLLWQIRDGSEVQDIEYGIHVEVDP